MKPAVSVIIPALNEAAVIGGAVAAAAAALPAAEVIVVDGGSSDGTAAEAIRAGAVVVHSPPGRGLQLANGARQAQGQALWFLHADALPADGAAALIAEALRSRRVCGGNFRVRFTGGSWAAAFMTWFYACVSRLGLSYGDSGIFVRRSVYEALGGFRPYPLFEDVEFATRLRRLGGFTTVSGMLLVSSRRFERRFVRTFLRWCTLQLLYWMGVSPYVLARAYKPVRAERRERLKTAPEEVKG